MSRILSLLMQESLPRHAVAERHPMQPPLLKLQSTDTHATDTQQSWSVLSANLKRKKRSWWGVAGPVQRRPVEGCRAEKILRSTNKNMEKKKGRKGRKKKKKGQKTRTMISEWRRKYHCLLLFESLISYRKFLVWNEINNQADKRGGIAHRKCTIYVFFFFKAGFVIG